MIIQARNLQKRFRVRVPMPGVLGVVRNFVTPRWRPVTAVDDLDLDVEPGEVIAFIGPNGAGKSTTIKLLTGILHRDAGSVSVLGMDPQRHRRRLAYRIGTVFGQKSQLWFHLPPLDTFKLLADVYDLEPHRARARIGELTEIFGIGQHLTTPVRKLSLGERIRCEIAASLIHEPELLLLDEPTIGLDVVIRQRIRDLIAQVNRERGVTVFLTSHDTGDVEQVCRRAIVINHGRIVWDGAVSELRSSLLTPQDHRPEAGGAAGARSAGGHHPPRGTLQRQAGGGHHPHPDRGGGARRPAPQPGAGHHHLRPPDGRGDHRPVRVGG